MEMAKRKTVGSTPFLEWMQMTWETWLCIVYKASMGRE